MKNRKILIFGFKPFGKYKSNISELVVKKINNKKITHKLILNVDLDKKFIIEKINRIKPDIIIGLGQHSRARKIKIERKAKNIIKYEKEKDQVPILKDSKKEIFTTLKIKKIKDTTISYDAGTYICNLVMFCILSHIIKNGINLKFAFYIFQKNII